MKKYLLPLLFLLPCIGYGQKNEPKLNSNSYANLTNIINQYHPNFNKAQQSLNLIISKKRIPRSLLRSK